MKGLCLKSWHVTEAPHQIPRNAPMDRGALVLCSGGRGGCPEEEPRSGLGWRLNPKGRWEPPGPSEVLGSQRPGRDHRLPWTEAVSDGGALLVLQFDKSLQKLLATRIAVYLMTFLIVTVAWAAHTRYGRSQTGGLLPG